MCSAMSASKQLSDDEKVSAIAELITATAYYRPSFEDCKKEFERQPGKQTNVCDEPIEIINELSSRFSLYLPKNVKFEHYIRIVTEAVKMENTR